MTGLDIKRIRENAGLKQDEFCVLLELVNERGSPHTSQLSRWETGHNLPGKRWRKSIEELAQRLENESKQVAV